MRVLDADGHIFEPEAMFAHLEEEFYPRRPVIVQLPSDTEYGDINSAWLVEGKLFPKIPGPGQTIFFLPGSARSLRAGATVGDQTIEDVDARLKGLDRFHIDQQVVFPTMFLVSAVEDVYLEAALFRAYNTYVSEACARSGGRLKWAALLLFRDPDAAVQEGRRAADLGAAGIFSLGAVFDLDEDLPYLLEYVPYAMNQIRRQHAPPTVLRDGSTAGVSRRGIDQHLYRDPVEWFREGRAFVTYETEEDLPYLLRHIGEDGLMLSSDYPHGDPSSDESYVDKLKLRDDIPDQVKQKLLADNAARFYRF